MSGFFLFLSPSHKLETSKLENQTTNTLALPPIKSVFQGKTDIMQSKIDFLYNFRFKWGSSGSGNGQFNRPYGIAINESGFVYVTDQTADHIDRVQVFSPKGIFVNKWSTGGYSSPWGIAINKSGYVYVAEMGNKRISIYTAGGKPIQYITYNLVNPVDVIINETGFIYVLDYPAAGARVAVYTPSGQYLFMWGGYGTNDGQFRFPQAFAFNSMGYLYVGDTNNYRVQVFKPDGTFITKWGAFGSGDGQFDYITDIAIDSNDYVYVADVDNDRIQIFTPSGQLITKWDTNLTNVWAIAFNSTEYIHTSHYGLNQIQVAKQSTFFKLDSTNVLVFSIPKNYLINITLNFQSNVTNTILYGYNYVGASWNVITYQKFLSNYVMNPNYYNGSLFQFRLRFNMSIPFWAKFIYNITMFYYDFTPPLFIHNQITYIKPNYQPLPSVNNLNISCLVFDKSQPLSIVFLQENTTGNLVNRTMINETLTYYFFYLDIHLLDGFVNTTLKYRFWANDTNNEVNWTQWYYIWRDFFGPTIVLWTEPAMPDYTQPVFLYANVTDLNGIFHPGGVSMRWSLNNWITNQTPITMVNTTTYGKNTWRTITPITAQSYWKVPYSVQTEVSWEILAKDVFGNWAYKYASYKIQDYTKPSVTSIVSLSTIQETETVIINVTMTEPSMASGINPSVAFVYYEVLSTHYIDVVPLYYYAGNLWQAELPGQAFNETVLFFVYVEDYAGNNYTSSVYEYTVTEVIVLVDWINFTFWVIVVLGVTLGVFAFLRKSIPKKYYYVLGIAMLVGITLLLWLLFPWWEFAGLNYQQYLQLLGSSWQISVIVGIGITLFVGVVGIWYLNPYRPHTPKAGTIVYIS
jgi:sugar lactone lactonase YvrE